MHQNRRIISWKTVGLLSDHTLPSRSHSQVLARAQSTRTTQTSRRWRHLHRRPQLPEVGMRCPHKYEVRSLSFLTAATLYMERLLHNPSKKWMIFSVLDPLLNYQRLYMLSQLHNYQLKRFNITCRCHETGLMEVLFSFRLQKQSSNLAYFFSFQCFECGTVLVALLLEATHCDNARIFPR